MEAFALFLTKYGRRDITLILIGGCRDESDRERVAKLKLQAERLGITDKVRFEVNASFECILRLLKESLIGLHTMVDEHFGISIVEFMTAGLITVANDSGGPKSDIIDHGVNGFRASTAAEYAAIFQQVLDMNEEERERLRCAAHRKSIEKFSNEAFMTGFQMAVFSPK